MTDPYAVVTSDWHLVATPRVSDTSRDLLDAHLREMVGRVGHGLVEYWVLGDVTDLLQEGAGIGLPEVVEATRWAWGLIEEMLRLGCRVTVLHGNHDWRPDDPLPLAGLFPALDLPGASRSRLSIGAPGEVSTMLLPCGRRVALTHGERWDPCWGPGVPRFFAALVVQLSGWAEARGWTDIDGWADRWKHRVLGHSRTDESMTEAGARAYATTLPPMVTALLYGHTHRPGAQGRAWNTGCWVGGMGDAVAVSATGEVRELYSPRRAG